MPRTAPHSFFVCQRRAHSSALCIAPWACCCRPSLGSCQVGRECEGQVMLCSRMCRILTSAHMHAYISFVSCNAFNYQCLFSVMDTHVCIVPRWKGKRQSFKSLRLPSRACMQRAKASDICMLMSLRARQQPATWRPPTIVIVNLQNVATKLCTGSHVQ